MNNNVHEELFRYDSALRKEYKIICGVDEAGRGPLAGDVYAAAVIFDDDVRIPSLDDSKKLSGKKREELYDIITEVAVSYCVATASVEEIESLNILRAAMLAMKRAVEGLKTAPDLAVVDGNKLPELRCNSRSLVKGDSISASVAAASVLAKVERDRYMIKLSEKYPQYGFEKHKGYGTKLHYENLRKYGPSPVHRQSFLKKFYDEQK